jgi:proline iminopeptidase
MQLIRVVSMGAALLAGAAIAVPRLLRFGATAEEAAQSLPGDDEVLRPHLQGTRAITIDAPVERVWPWLAQIGYHGYARAGWYALDLADNDAVPSLWKIVPEFQHPEVGQRVGEEGFVVRAIEPYQFLVFAYRFPKTEWVLKQGLWPRFGHCGWAFVLRPLPGGKTRLISRTRYRVLSVDLSALFWPFFLASDLLVQPLMLRGIRRRVESTAGNEADSSWAGARHESGSE